jgi:AcrR family transcriptional regulator
MTTVAGLRERKKQKTRDAIQRAAMRLFAEQGYEATTIEQIADAVEISPSTFFNYFPSKEDVVFTDDYDQLFVSVFAGRPAEEPLGVAIRQTVTQALGEVLERDRDVILTRARLVLSEPALRARVWEDLVQAQQQFASLIASRTGRPADDFEVRITAMVVVAALAAASEEWVRSDGRPDMMEMINRALDVVETGAQVHLTA